MVKDRNNELIDIQSLQVPPGAWGHSFENRPQTLLKGVKWLKEQLERPSSHLESITIRLDNLETMLVKYTFLLIGEKAESQWPLALEHALSPLGELQIVSQQEASQKIVSNEYQVIIVDAGTVPDPAKLVASLRKQQPAARIVVATASPTWQRARETLQAGAADYIYKSLDEKRLRSEIQAVLDEPA